MHKILANTVFLGKEVIHLTECHSTNDEALRRLRAKEIVEGSIVIADNQTKGRGQRGNTWEVESDKNLTFSIILRPGFLSVSEQFWLNTIVCLSVWETVSAYSEGIFIKWPNDIVHQEMGKICGVLIENLVQGSTIEHSVVGIGLNVNQGYFRLPNVCSLATLTGTQFDKWAVLDNFVQNLERKYLLLKRGYKKELKHDYHSRLYQLNEWGMYNDGEPFEGKILEVGDDGKLCIRLKNGLLKYYYFKEVRFL